MKTWDTSSWWPTRRPIWFLGANMMGPHVTDIIHEVALAVQNGLTVSQLGDTIHAHPSVAEALMEAAHDAHGESVHIAR